MKFEYDPQTEDIGAVVREMVDTLELDQTREKEIVKAIRCKLDELDSNRSPRHSGAFDKSINSKSSYSKTATPSMSYDPSVASSAAYRSPAPSNRAPSSKRDQYPNSDRKPHPKPLPQSDFNNHPKRATTEPPAHLNVDNRKQNATNYSEPTSAGTAQELRNQFGAEGGSDEQYPVNHTRPKVFGPGHRQTASQNPNRRVKPRIPAPPSAPVTPGPSPPNDKNLKAVPGFHIDGTRSEIPGSSVNSVYDDYPDPNGQLMDNDSDKTNNSKAPTATPSLQPPSTALVRDSLLDQIMVLPPETVKARIRKFGGTVSDCDGPGSLVTKLFQLLSDNAPKMQSAQHLGNRSQGEDTLKKQLDAPGLSIAKSTGIMPNPPHPMGTQESVHSLMNSYSANPTQQQQQQHHQEVASNHQSVNTTPPNELNVSNVSYIGIPPITAAKSQQRQVSDGSVHSLQSAGHPQHQHFNSAQPPKREQQHRPQVNQVPPQSVQSMNMPSHGLQQPGQQYPTPQQPVVHKQPTHPQSTMQSRQVPTVVQQQQQLQAVQPMPMQQMIQAQAAQHVQQSSAHRSLSSVPSIPSHSHSQQNSNLSQTSQLSQPSHISQISQSSQHSQVDSESPTSQQNTPTISPQSNAKMHVPGHSRTHSNTSINSTGTVIRKIPKIVDDDEEGEDEEEMEPAKELAWLKKKRIELMKKKMVAQKKELSQKTSSKLGKDNKMDDIASELSKCEKRMKVLSGAVKTGKKPPPNREMGKIKRDNSYPSDRDDDKSKVTHSNQVNNQRNNSAVSIDSDIPSTMHRRNTSTDSLRSLASQHKVHSPPQAIQEQPTKNNHYGGINGGNGDRNAFRLQAVNDTSELSVGGDLDISVIANNTHSRSNSTSIIVETDGSFPGSSPLISSTAKDEFKPYIQDLPQALDLGGLVGDGRDLNALIDSKFNQSQSDLRNLSAETLRNAKVRVQRERHTLEEEYKQYYEDQTDLLMLKLGKCRENAAKRESETSATRKKLKDKQQQQSAKFQSIMRDQLQILQLTQELNEDAGGVSSASKPNSNQVIPENEVHFYKDQLDKLYLKRIQEFKMKQEQELKFFQDDLNRLSDLQMELYKKKKRSSHGSSVNDPSSSTSPLRGAVSPKMMDREEVMEFSGQLSSAESLAPTQSMPSRPLVDQTLMNGLPHATPLTASRSSVQALPSSAQHQQGFCAQPSGGGSVGILSGGVGVGSSSLGMVDQEREGIFSPNSTFYHSSSVPSILDHSQSAGSHLNGSMNGTFRAGPYGGAAQQIQSQHGGGAQQHHHHQSQSQQQQQYHLQAQQGGNMQYQRQTANMMQNKMQKTMQQQHPHSSSVSRTHSQPNPNHGPSSQHPPGSQTLNSSFDLHSNSSNANK